MCRPVLLSLTATLKIRKLLYIIKLKPVGYNGDYEAFVWQPFTYDDVLKQVKAIQINKASGFSLIASKIWKIVFTEFASILTHILIAP